MANHHFISYSSVDGADFALKLCDALAAGPDGDELLSAARVAAAGVAQ